jgi:hypothetical protein
MNLNSTPSGESSTQSSTGDIVEQPAKNVEDYRVGGLDKRGRRVREILWVTKDFVIFRHDQGISPHFSNDDTLAREQARRYMRLGRVISRVNALLPPANAEEVRPTHRGWSFFHTPDAFLYRETARAIANALVGQRGDALEILAFVEDRLIARRRVQGQIQYLLACTAMLAIIMLVAGLIEFWLRPPQMPWGDLVEVATSGAAGGFLSVAIGIRELDIDPGTRWWINAYYGLNRLTISVVSAGVLYILIKGKLVFEPLFSGSPQDAFVLYALAIAAGFSETLVPNILKSTESEKPNKNAGLSPSSEYDAPPAKPDGAASQLLP